MIIRYDLGFAGLELWYKAIKKILKAAKLPLHFTPHCLRHTFASLLLQQGQSPAYVQRQLGHASIQLTVDTYGRWLPMGDKTAVNRLADRVVTAMAASATGPDRLSPPEGRVSEGSVVIKWLAALPVHVVPRRGFAAEKNTPHEDQLHGPRACRRQVTIPGGRAAPLLALPYDPSHIWFRGTTR